MERGERESELAIELMGFISEGDVGKLDKAVFENNLGWRSLTIFEDRCTRFYAKNVW